MLFSGGFFTRLEGSARCNTCNTVLKRTGGSTTGCHKHLQNKHKKEYSEYSKKKEQTDQERSEEKANEFCGRRKRKDSLFGGSWGKQPRLLSEDGKLKINLPPIDKDVQKEWNDALIDHMAESYASFSQMSSPSFTKLINVINKRSRHRIEVQSRHTLSRKAKTRAEEILSDVAKIIIICRAKMASCAFTSDIWTSLAGDAFFSFTVHFIDR